MPERKFVLYFNAIGKRKFCEHWLALPGTKKGATKKGATKTAAPSKTRIRR
jgi:hypothetical protein